MGEEIVPVYGEGFFHVTWGVIFYTIVFDYIDRTGSFWRRMRDPEERRREEQAAAENMQRLMDEERVVVNGMDTRTVVDYARLEFRGDRVRHSLVFHTRIPFQPIDGINVYENYYEPTRAPYSYTVYWVAPPGGEIVSVESPGKVTMEAQGRIAVIHVREGTRIPGYESVAFRLREPRRQSII